jgi:hypothetical protein
MNAETNGPTPAETLAGKSVATVTLLDGSRETVALRQLPLKEMEALLAAQGDETKLACLYTGRPESWFDGVSPEGQELIVQEGDRLNADFFGRWFRRRLDRQERLIPGSRARLLGVLDGAAAEAAVADVNSTLPNSQQVRLVPAG